MESLGLIKIQTAKVIQSGKKIYNVSLYTIYQRYYVNLETLAKGVKYVQS